MLDRWHEYVPQELGKTSRRCRFRGARLGHVHTPLGPGGKSFHVDVGDGIRHPGSALQSHVCLFKRYLNKLDWLAERSSDYGRYLVEREVLRAMDTDSVPWFQNPICVQVSSCCPSKQGVDEVGGSVVTRNVPRWLKSYVSKCTLRGALLPTKGSGA